MKDKKTYKEINGTTRVGDFLRSINKGKVLDVASEIVQGDLLGAAKAIFNSDLSEDEKAHASKLVELDIAEQQAVAQKWTADMGSDSWLSKNVRPLSLVFLTVSTIFLIYLDSFVADIIVPIEWIDLLNSLLLTVFVSYFGSRGFEKATSLRKS